MQKSLYEASNIFPLMHVEQNFLTPTTWYKKLCRIHLVGTVGPTNQMQRVLLDFLAIQQTAPHKLKISSLQQFHTIKIACAIIFVLSEACIWSGIWFQKVNLISVMPQCQQQTISFDEKSESNILGTFCNPKIIIGSESKSYSDDNSAFLCSCQSSKE